MQAVLVMFRSDGDRRSFSITRDMTVIGRREDCDLRIPLGEVSRKHCRLVRDGDTLRLEDLGSSNGTYVNGQRVQEHIVSPGDSMQIGPVIFVAQIDGYPGDDELQPVAAHAAEMATAATPSGDMGPLSPTAASEVSDVMEGLDPLPAPDTHSDLDDIDMGFESLPPQDGDLALEPMPALEEKHPATNGKQAGALTLPPINDRGANADAAHSHDMDLLPFVDLGDGPATHAGASHDLMNNHGAIPLDDLDGIDLLPADHEHGDKEEIYDLDLGVEAPHQPHA